MNRCEWCRDPNADDVVYAERLCRMHQAEYEGTSLAGLERMKAAERADMADLGYFD